ncbi:MAG: hypothetical protein U0326_14175 [Polyangiales bacterium]
MREALRPIEGIVEVRLVGPHLWIIRDEVNVARDRRISHALGDLVDDYQTAAVERAGMVPEGLRVL